MCDFASFGGNPFWGEGSQDSLPDGIHLMSRANDTERDLFSTGLVRVKTLNGQRFIRGFQPPGAGLERSNVTPIYSREFRALGLNAQNGLSFVYTSAKLGLFYGMAHFSMIESLCLGFYPGCRLIFSEMGNHNRYITPTLLDPLSQKTSTILEAAWHGEPRELAATLSNLFCATQADAGVVSRNIRKRKGGVKNPPNREFRMQLFVCF